MTKHADLLMQYAKDVMNHGESDYITSLSNIFHRSSDFNVLNKGLVALLSFTRLP